MFLQKLFSGLGWASSPDSRPGRRRSRRTPLSMLDLETRTAPSTVLIDAFSAAADETLSAPPAEVSMIQADDGNSEDPDPPPPPPPPPPDGGNG